MKKLISIIAGFLLVSCASATAPLSNPVFTGTVTLPGSSTSTLTGSGGNITITTSVSNTELFLYPAGGVNVGANVVPGSSSTFSLGQSSDLWQDIYGQQLWAGTSLHVGGGGFTQDLKIDQSGTSPNPARFNMQNDGGYAFTGVGPGMTLDGGIYPSTGTVASLGVANTNSWQSIYLGLGAFTGVEFDNGGALFSAGTGSSAITTLTAAALGGLRINGEATGTQVFGTGVSANGPLALDANSKLATGLYPKQATVYISSNQNITASTETTVTWNAASANDGTMWSAGSPTLLSVPSGATRVRAIVVIRWAGMANGTVLTTKIKDNNSTVWAVDSRAAESTGGGSPPGLTLSTPWINLSTYTTITSFLVSVEQESGGTVAITANGTGAGSTNFSLEAPK